MKMGFLIDMDGVIYRENHLIPGAADFVQALNASGTPFLFVTNNSAPTPEDLAVRLKHLGITGLSARHFYTSALNTAEFLSETDPGCTVFVIGEGGLLSALHERKIANDGIQPRYVIVGEGAATMERLAKAHECVERGALLLATTRTTGVLSPPKRPGPAPVPPRRSWKRAPAGALTTSVSPTVTCSIAPAASWRNSRSTNRSRW